MRVDTPTQGGHKTYLRRLCYTRPREVTMRYQLLRLSARAVKCLAVSLAAMTKQLEQHGLAHPVEIDPEVTAEWRRFKEARARFWQACSTRRKEDHDAQ